MKIPRFNSLFSVLLAFGRSLILKLAVRCVCFMIASWKLWPWWNWQINRDGPVLSLLGQHHVLFIYAYVSPYEASIVLASPADILKPKNDCEGDYHCWRKSILLGYVHFNFFAWFCLFLFFAAGWFWSFSLTLGVLLSYDRIDEKKFSRSFYYLCSSDKN